MKEKKRKKTPGPLFFYANHIQQESAICKNQWNYRDKIPLNSKTPKGLTHSNFLPRRELLDNPKYSFNVQSSTLKKVSYKKRTEMIVPNQDQ